MMEFIIGMLSMAVIGIVAYAMRSLLKEMKSEDSPKERYKHYDQIPKDFGGDVYGLITGDGTYTLFRQVAVSWEPPKWAFWADVSISKGAATGTFDTKEQALNSIHNHDNLHVKRFKTFNEWNDYIIENADKIISKRKAEIKRNNLAAKKIKK